MKHARKLRNWRFPLCFAALLCGLLAVSASAAALSPNELQITLKWSNVDAGAGATVSNGQLVTAGDLTFYEDGVQQTFGGSALIPIDPSGTTTISYAFDPAKTYTVTVEEKAEAPYYMTKDIVLSADDVAAAISTGMAINNTVDWTQWAKPIKLSLVDAAGAPLSIQGVNIALYGMDSSGGFYGPEPRATNASGSVAFPTRSYLYNDSEMTTVEDQIFFTAQYSANGRTTMVARVFDLSKNTHNGQDPSHKRHNEVELFWPTATVSGTVYKANGSPAPAGTRVAAYYALPEQGNPFVDVVYDDSDSRRIKLTDLRFWNDLCVYYTATDANGNYTIALPAGPVELCAGDSSPTKSGIFTNSTYSGQAPVKYYTALRPHFPWISVINATTPKEAGATSFAGVYCQERPSLTLNVTDEDMTGQDLHLDTSALNGYHLKANVTVNGEPATGNLSLYFALLDPSNPPSTFHTGSYSETYLYPSATNGRIDSNYVKLAPGYYKVYCRTKFEIAEGYSVIPSPTRVTIPSASTYAGEVDLGTLNFIIAPRPTSPSGTPPAVKIPGPIHYTPLSKPPYAHLSTQIEAIPDPAYGPFAYQFTVHYCANYTGSDLTQLDGCKLEIVCPLDADILSPGQFASSSNSSQRTLTWDLPTLEIGKPYSTTFTADIRRATGDVTLTVYSSPNEGDNGETDNVLKPTSAITLHRPRITLNGPRAVGAAGKFRVFGNAAGTGGTGITLYKKGPDTPIATGANKGRYYYFNVGGQAAGDYKLFARTQRFGQSEDSNEIDVTVTAAPAIEVEDAYIMRGSKKTGINANFGMVYYTSFIAYDKHVPDFDVYFKLSQAPAEGEAVSLDIGGLSYAAEAPNSDHPDYYKASVSSLYATGEQSVLLKVGSGFTTQLACLTLIF